jgi:hypothetical protein
VSGVADLGGCGVISSSSGTIGEGGGVGDKKVRNCEVCEVLLGSLQAGRWG